MLILSMGKFLQALLSQFVPRNCYSTGMAIKEDPCDLIEQFELSGYVVFRLEDSDNLIDAINCDIDILVKSGDFRTNSKFYSYNSSPRIVEAWRYSDPVHQLVFHPKILSVLQILFGQKPLPFSTINFLRSTEQPFHSDAVHFPTQPPNQLAAAWVALEDIDLKSGPLQVVPGSHTEPEFVYSQIGVSPARSISDLKAFYSAYEERVVEQIEEKFLVPVIPRLSKGDCLIWHSNLLHGSPECIDNTLSRRSQVTHYHFGEDTNFYNLAFSDPNKNKFFPRMVEYIPSNV